VVGREQLSIVLLAGLGLAVAVGLVVLVWKVKGAAPPVVSAGQLGSESLASRAPPPSRSPAENDRPEPPEPRPMIAAPSVPPPTEAGADPRGETAPAVDLQGRTHEAIAAYDRGDYEVAVERALGVLDVEPDNVRMLRVTVSSSCMLGEVDRARSLYPRLPERDKQDIRRRCARFGIQF
jgi:hypothetical protein